MKSYSDFGIILKISQLQEANKLVIIWGKRSGKISALTKGAGKTLSRKGGSLDYLNLGKFAFHKGHNFDVITEVELVEDFHELKENLINISNIFYLLDLLDHFLPESEKAADFFADFVSFLEIYGSGNTNKDLLLSYFELKTLQFFGYEPELNNCLHCQEPLQIDLPRIAATRGQAGYLCARHFNTTVYRQFLVNDQVIKLQKFMLSAPLEKLHLLNVNRELQQRIRDVQKTWIEGILENHLQSNIFKEQVKYYN